MPGAQAVASQRSVCWVVRQFELAPVYAGRDAGMAIEQPAKEGRVFVDQLPVTCLGGLHFVRGAVGIWTRFVLTVAATTWSINNGFVRVLRPSHHRRLQFLRAAGVSASSG